MNKGNHVSTTAGLPTWLLTVITPERFHPYRVGASNFEDALDLYRKNLLTTGALVRWVSFAEVAIRNAVCQQLSYHFCEVENIFDSLEPLLTKEGKETLKSARKNLSKVGLEPTASRIVTELPFGFWKYLFSSRYEATLWTPVLRQAFPKVPTQSRSLVADAIQHIADLRNRLAHNEPVFMRNLNYDMTVIQSTIEWVSPEARAWAKANIPDIFSPEILKP